MPGVCTARAASPHRNSSINPDSCFSIGLNVDRDHVTLVVLDFVGKVRARASREIHFAKPATVSTFFQRSIGQLLAKAGIARDRLVGVGVAFPDDIARAHLPDQPADYAAWASVRIEDLIRDVLGDSRVHRKRCRRRGDRRNAIRVRPSISKFFYLLVTAALGGGLVADGSYFRGANGRSGEIGWLRARNEAGERQSIAEHRFAVVPLQPPRGAGFRVATPARTYRASSLPRV